MDTELKDEIETPVIEKPAMKRRVNHYGVQGSRQNMLHFDADEEIAKDLEYFGKVVKDNFSGAHSLYYIVVDGRFDMADVLDYMDRLNGGGKVGAAAGNGYEAGSDWSQMESNDLDDDEFYEEFDAPDVGF